MAPTPLLTQSYLLIAIWYTNHLLINCREVLSSQLLTNILDSLKDRNQYMSWAQVSTVDHYRQQTEQPIDRFCIWVVAHPLHSTGVHIIMSSIARSVYDRVWHWYFVYELRTSLYMLEPWEKTTFNTALVAFIAMASYTTYAFLPTYTRSALTYFGLIWLPLKLQYISIFI